MRRVPIRLKLAAALSIPLLALGVVTVLEVVKSADDVSEIREQTDLAVAAIGPSGLITALQNERTWPAVDLVGQAGMVNVPVEGYEETRGDTDEAHRRVPRAVIGQGRLDRRRASGRSLDAARPSSSSCAPTSTPTWPPSRPARSTTTSTSATHDLRPLHASDRTRSSTPPPRISLAIDDPELRQGTELADAAAREIEVMSLLPSAAIRDDRCARHGARHRRRDRRRARRSSRPSSSNADVIRNATGVVRRHRGRALPRRADRRRHRRTSTRRSPTARSTSTPSSTASTCREDEGYVAFQDAIADRDHRARRVTATSAARPGSGGSSPSAFSCSARRSC